jgi:hypothetical protein
VGVPTSDRNRLDKVNLRYEIFVTAFWFTMVFSDVISYVLAHMEWFGTLTNQQVQATMLLATFVPMFALLLAEKIFEDYRLFFKAYSGIVLLLIFLALIPMTYKDFGLSAGILLEALFLSVLGLFLGQILLYKFKTLNASIMHKNRLAALARVSAVFLVTLLRCFFPANIESGEMIGYTIWLGGLLIISLFRRPESGARTKMKIRKTWKRP